MDSSDSCDDNGNPDNLNFIYCGVPMLVLGQRYAFLRLKRDLN